MANANYELVTPRDVIQSFIECRSNPTYENIKQLCERCGISVEDADVFKLFGDFCSLDRGDYFLGSLFDRIRNCETNNSEDIKLAVKTLNSIYHTRLLNSDNTADEIYARFDDIKECFRKREFVSAIETITNIHMQEENQNQTSNHIYSFASKFCSFYDVTSFPIFDKYSSNLVYWYLQRKKKTGEDVMYKYKTYLGIPDYFLGAYNEFIKLYELNDYKKADIFLWMYGKMLEYRHIKSFESIPYIPKGERNNLSHYPIER